MVITLIKIREYKVVYLWMVVLEMVSISFCSSDFFFFLQLPSITSGIRVNQGGFFVVVFGGMGISGKKCKRRQSSK